MSSRSTNTRSTPLNITPPITKTTPTVTTATSIPDDHYHANFGHGHTFHMMRPWMVGGYNRFEYGGYWFGYNQRWPVGWNYDDDVYVVYERGGYYMYNLRHPGIHITLSVF